MTKTRKKLKLEKKNRKQVQMSVKSVRKLGYTWQVFRLDEALRVFHPRSPSIVELVVPSM